MAERADWSERHEGIDPAGVPLLRPWLRLVDALARPVRWVPPDAVSLAGVGTALVSARLARSGRPSAAAVAVVVSGVLDGVDGAVAAASGRVSRHGRALDSACDRAAELAHLSALRAAGVPPAAAVLLAGLTTALEVRRRRAGGHLRLTVWERPSRVVLAVVGLVAAAAVPGATRTTGGVTGAVGVGLAGAALGQLSRRPGDPSRSASPAVGRGGSPA